MWIIERMSGPRITERELHARIMAELAEVSAAWQQFELCYLAGDLDELDPLELHARRHAARLRQLLPHLDHRRRRPRPRPAEVDLDERYRRAAQA